MATHATISVRTPAGEFHANMLADGDPAGFGPDLRAIVDSITPPETNAAPELQDLEQAFFSPLERDRSHLPPKLVRLLTMASTSIERSAAGDQLGDAWYRYEIDAATAPIRVTAFGRNRDELGLPSLRDGWQQIFRGTLEEFSQWSERFDPDEQAENDSMRN